MTFRIGPFEIGSLQLGLLVFAVATLLAPWPASGIDTSECRPGGGVPSWAVGRDAAGCLLVDTGSSLGTLTMNYERSEANSPGGLCVGCAGSPDRCSAGEPCHFVAWDWRTDQYNGRPPGSCLAGAASCGGTGDAFQIWKDRGWFRHYLFKQVEARNAYKDTGASHADLFQWLMNGNGGAGKGTFQDDDWIVVQDAIFSNSDDQHLLFTGYAGNPHGIVVQNVTIQQEEWFNADCRIRALSFGTETVCPSTTIIGAADLTSPGGAVWLVDVDYNVRFEIRAVGSPANFPVILIDTVAPLPGSGWNGRFCHYPDLETALADADASDGCGGWIRPPFIDLTCSGWSQPPSGCVATRGAGPGVPGPPPPPPPPDPPGTVSIDRLVLYDADTDQPLHDPWTGQLVDLDATPRVAVEAVVDGVPGSVGFVLDGDLVRYENSPPYAVLDSGPGSFEPWRPPPGAGIRSLTVTAYPNANGVGTPEDVLTIGFSVLGGGPDAMGPPGKPYLVAPPP